MESVNKELQMKDKQAQAFGGKQSRQAWGYS